VRKSLPNAYSDSYKSKTRIRSVRHGQNYITTLNWWPGALRPYESIYSFAARFCRLNEISIKRFESFFGFRVGEEDHLEDMKIQHISVTLNEDARTVRSIFHTLIGVHDGLGNHRLQSLYRQYNFRYCSQCAQLGYHSYLHDLPWLERCPFHLHKLEHRFCRRGISSSSIVTSTVDTVTDLMLSHCRSWPRWGEGDLIAAKFPDNPHLRLLSDWIVNVNAAAQQQMTGYLSLGHEWTEPEERSYKHFMSRLRSLEAVPTPLEHLFGSNGSTWNLVTFRYSESVKDELTRTSQYASLRTLFRLYKSVCAHSDQPCAFVTRLRTVQAELQEACARCRCGWGLQEAGWSSHWVKVNPLDWPHWGCKCPYEFASEELERGWGCPERTQSTRQAWRTEFHFIDETGLLSDAGLIGYTPNAVLLPNGRLAVAPQVWPCCNWNEESPLTRLLSDAAECEINMAVRRIYTWLEAIDGGAPPYGQDITTGCVGVRNTAAGLTLLQWGP
jgi:hypothetical protein